MSLQTIARRVGAIHEKLLPRPRIINCTGARDELLVMLEAGMMDEEMADEEMHAPVEWTEEQLEMLKALDAVLEADVKRIQEEYNVKLVNYE